MYSYECGGCPYKFGRRTLFPLRGGPAMPSNAKATVLNQLSAAPWSHMGEWTCRSPFLRPRQQLEVSGQFHDPAALPPGRSPWYTLDRRLFWPQRRCEWRGEVNILDPSGTRRSVPCACVRQAACSVQLGRPLITAEPAGREDAHGRSSGICWTPDCKNSCSMSSPSHAEGTALPYTDSRPKRPVRSPQKTHTAVLRMQLLDSRLGQDL
jgi:hypothetical protein